MFRTIWVCSLQGRQSAWAQQYPALDKAPIPFLNDLSVNQIRGWMERNLKVNLRRCDFLKLNFFCEGETLRLSFSPIERISRQWLGLHSTYHNEVGVWTKSLDSSMPAGSMELPVRLCAAHLHIHIRAHISALMFWPFFQNSRNNSASCCESCDFAVYCRSKKIEVNLKPKHRLPENLNNRKYTRYLLMLDNDTASGRMMHWVHAGAGNINIYLYIIVIIVILYIYIYIIRPGTSCC
jgi:hypothetical protein